MATPAAAALPTAAAVAAAGSGWTAVTARLRALRSELEETALRLANAERVRQLITLILYLHLKSYRWIDTSWKMFIEAAPIKF